MPDCEASQAVDAEAQAARVAAVESSRWRPLFDAVLPQILIGYEDQEQKVRDAMETGMRGLFNKPFEKELQALPGCKFSGGVEDAHRITFFPRLSDMPYYVKLFSMDNSKVTERRMVLMKFKLLSVFYTLHRTDSTLMDRFMHCGGLESLANLAGDDNNIVQSEATEILFELLTPLVMLHVASSSRQRHLYHQVYLCLRSSTFWGNMARIVASPAEVFPNSHSRCVKMIAAAVGWLHPPEQELPECGSLLPDMAEVSEALKIFSKSSIHKEPDVGGITEDLLDEFKTSPVIRADPLSGKDLKSAHDIIFEPEAVAREDAAHAWQTLRRLGNEAYKRGDVWPAEASYRMALEVGGDIVPFTDASLIDSNRALTLLKAGHHAEAAAAAASALARDPRNAKAAYRRALALLEMSHSSKSAEILAMRAAVEAAEIAMKLEPNDAKVADTLSRAKGRLDKLGESESEAEAVKEEPALDSMD